MQNEDAKIRELIFAYEDLEGEERDRVDAYLAEHEGARREFERLRELEGLARDPVPLKEEATSSFDLSADDERQEARSLDFLRARLGLSKIEREPHQPRTATPSSQPWRKRYWIPLAAAAVLVFFLMTLRGDRAVELLDLRVVAVDSATDTTRAINAGAAWSSGDAFALSFRLEEDAAVIIYHVDPLGEVQLAHPAEFAAGPATYSGGAEHRIPSASGDEQWILGAQTGRESFLLGAAAGETLRLAELDAAVHAELAGTVGRDAVLAKLRSLLEARLSTVELLEFDHVD